MSEFHFKRELESNVADTVVARAENNGWIARAMPYRGRRGCRDYAFYGFGQIVLMECKREKDGKLSWNQRKERKRLADVGVTVHVVNNAELGIEILRGLMGEGLLL
jgi:hypothetical protein